MALDTINTRGEVVAALAKKVRIKMIGAVKGEEGETLLPKSVHTVSEPFARELIRRGKAVDAATAKDDANGRNNGGKKGGE
ncbi:MAG TPA: hypothetical protein VF158_15880 [Longimicrobiales bacterium]